MEPISPGPSISVVLPTIFRRDLIKSTLESIYPQLQSRDELLVSLNVHESEVKRCIDDLEQFITARFTSKPVKITYITPGRKLRVYEHWNFAINSAINDEIIFIHDDEIYNSNLIKIAREEFAADKAVTLIIGGQANVYPVKGELCVIKKIWFEARKTYEPNLWIASQEDLRMPKFAATTYVFRRPKNGFWFFEEDIRVSDSLLMYYLSVKGKVVERAEIFGTHLHHASNTFLTYYLESNHQPYWFGLQKIGEMENQALLIQAAEAVKLEVASDYSRNALFAALPLGDRRGWAECLRQCDLAKVKPRLLLRLVQRIPFVWAFGPPLLRFSKWLTYKFAKGKKISRGALKASALKDFLGLPTEVLDSFQRRANCNSR